MSKGNRPFLGIMVCLGEVSAIVGLITTATQLSKAVVDIVSKYKEIRNQIESFGHGTDLLCDILDKMVPSSE